MCDETLFDPDLKRVPIIIVFTQYDELVDRKIMELIEAGGEGIDQEELYRKAAPSAESDFDSLCIQPLKKLCKLMKKESIPPNIRVSVRSRYEDTLTQLIHLTKSTVLHRPDPIRP
ncbi:hypothetical protein FRC03_001352 [Tulasnella sp. 419]|nr:hypothetical protein FRC03_001352 [Tulasnella sp. 419]